MPAPTSTPAAVPTWESFKNSTESFKDAVTSIPEKISIRFNGSSDVVKTFVSENALGFASSAAFVGSGLAVNSTINLIKHRGQSNLAKEITKVAAGAGITALSIYSVNGNDQRLTVGLIAATTGLAAALFRAVTDAPVSVRAFILKKRDGDSQIAARLQGNVASNGDFEISRLSVFVADSPKAA